MNPKLEDAQRKIEEAVSALVTGDDWKKFLAQSARFHNYSANNVFLIMLQSGCTATRVAGYKKWQEFGRQVKKGESGMQILRPLAYKRTEDDGSVVHGIRGFGLTYVWDVSQTEGDPLAEELVKPSLLDSGEGAQLYAQLAAQVESAGYVLERTSHAELNGANGDTHYELKRVRVRNDVTQLQATKTLAHELVHIVLGHGEDGKYRECRGQREVEAESTAYLVLDAAGLVSDDYTFAYVAHWANGSVEAVKNSAQSVVKAAHAITKEW
jgi:antirestriction protein ArdC